MIKLDENNIATCLDCGWRGVLSSHDGRVLFYCIKCTDPFAEPEPGRNDPCPCGSGQKWKRCHRR